MDLSGLDSREQNEFWNGKDDRILVENIPIWEFIEKTGRNRFEMMRENVVQIARIFNNCLKSFFKHIILSEDQDFSFEYYSRRVEYDGGGEQIVND